MQQYANVSGGSGVRGYQSGSNYIDVYFSDGAIYRYTYASAGSSAVEQMKRLATAGSGLNGYINQYVRKAYAAKLR